MICESPELLGPLGDGLRFVPIWWEVHLGPGRLDLLLIDSEGIPTLVETKLEANDESRRKVIGQVLEYASYATEWTVQDLRRMAAEFLETEHAPDDIRGLSLEAALVLRLEWTEDEDSERDAKIEALFARTAAALRSGRLRVVCGVDERIDSLERIVRFLSAHSDLQVVAVAGEPVQRRR